MRLTMRERKAVTKVLAERYRKAGKKDKGRILDELSGLAGYSRCYGAYLLRCQGKRVRMGWVVLVGDIRLRPKRRWPKRYDQAVLDALKPIWKVMDYPCGKRLAAMLPEVLPILERHQEIELSALVRDKLLAASAATLDRLLSGERRRLRLRGRAGTKPGTLLKRQIPIRTFAEWNEAVPGFVEIDLVGHDGGDAHGEFCQTLDVTDVASAWTETEAVINKAQVWVFEALKTIRTRLPFALQGIDSDNGAEFINHQLLRYCQQEKITFTRGRAWKKNDGCFVEQKNYSVVRRAVGYARYDTPAQLRLLNELYRELRPYTNFFQPVMKLAKKERIGAKVKKTYAAPQTPYQRVLNSPVIGEETKKRLRVEYAGLNPAQLKRDITRLQDRLLKTAAQRSRARRQFPPSTRATTADQRRPFV